MLLSKSAEICTTISMQIKLKGNNKMTFVKSKAPVFVLIAVILLCTMTAVAFADGTGDVAGAVQGTWDTAKVQIRQIVDNVVFPVIDLVLAVLFFAKLALSYLDYRKHGQFEWTAPAILFATLVFSLTAPLYIWDIIGM